MRSLFFLALLSALLIFADANQKPRWIEDLSDKLQSQGISENTKTNSSLGFIKCVDDDPGDYVRYSIRDVTYLDVNALTGEVIVNGNLDREASSNSQAGGNQPYSVHFECSDYGPDGKIKSTIFSDIIITVRDENDQKPVFSTDSPTGYTFSVSESEEPGYKLNGTLTVTDSDKKYPNAGIQRVELVCEPPAAPADCELFQVQYQQMDFGKYIVNLYLRAKLDYEDEPVYTIGIRAVDGDSNSQQINTATVGILVNVLDSQDTPPRFQNTVLNFNVEEGLTVGTAVNFRLSAMDMDTTLQRDIAFEILPQSSASLTGVDFFRAGEATKDQSGIFSAPVIVNEPIDREQASDVYTFTAKATELDSNGNPTTATATAQFTVNIKDKNDNAPEFSKDKYYVTIPEADPAIGNQVITVEDLQVVDPDRLNNAKYRVEVIRQTINGAFNVLPDTEVAGAQGFNLLINNFQLVDYENPEYRSQAVVLRAVETVTSERRSSTATVFITVTDVNDNSPAFFPQRYEGSVSERAAIGTSIVTLSATDVDFNSNGEIFYRLSDQATKFTVDNTSGVITLSDNNLDYEQKRRYIFLAYAVDRGNPPRSSEASVVVEIIDFNEEGPQFTSDQYRGVVTDGRREFNERVQVEAIDPTDPNANITYRIVDGNTPTNFFHLDPFTGELTLLENITYAMTPDLSGLFRLEVEATDNGKPPLSQRMFIIVDVLAQNNYHPIFNPTTYSKTISETVPPGEYLLTVSATDADYGTNGQIVYRIGTGGQDSFIVRENGSVFISASPTLNYDVYNSLTVQVIATDGGSPQRSATATMFITVTDSNNQKPVFTRRLYSKVIDEGTPKGTSVLTVSASDKDTTSKLRYSLDPNSISAYNKNAVNVENPLGYDLKSVFEINPETGVISLSPSGPGLDRSFVTEMSFDVIVTDTNGVDQTDTSMVTIFIKGQPETELFFNRPWTVSEPWYVLLVSESTEVGAEIKTLQARDPVNGSVVTNYQEISGDPDDYFTLSVSSPGKVLLNRPLDYERPTKRRQSVVIAAIKEPTGNYPRRTATVTVIMEVQDANDNPPIFTRQDYDFVIPEDVPMDYEVTQITAYDLDSPSFGPIEFMMGIGQDRNDFRLETTATPGTVRLLVNLPLDFEKRHVYQLEIIAKDNSQEGTGSSLRLESKIGVKISLTDVNDNKPTFTDRKRAFSVPETAQINTRLGQVLAQDDDSGLFGEIIYSLEAEGSSQGVNPLQLFSITQQSGVLVTRQSLRGLSGVYNVWVVARDRGSPPRSDSIPVEIKVQGVEDDDGTPRWVSPTRFVVYVTEHNKTKLDVSLRAEPRTPNAGIVYSLSPLDDDYLNFRIDHNTGDIFVTAFLDREVQETYKLLVEATDTVDSTKMSRRELTVHLIDINDNEPSFRKSNYTACPTDFEVPAEFSVPDETPENTIVASVMACDPDGPENSYMYYYRYTDSKICGDNYNDALLVNVNGTIQTTKVLDYEEKEDYLVCVEVRSSPIMAGGRRKRAYDTKQMNETDTVAYIVINVEDLNDNGPEFPNKTVTGVMGTQPSEDSVIEVMADDPDGPLNDRVVYAIKDVMYYPASGRRPFSMRGAFSINPDKGVISPRLPSYQDFTQGHFELHVEAFDAKDRNFNNTVIITMVVYQRSQILKVVLNKLPDEGQAVADQMIADLNKEGKKSGQEFFLISASEHRSADKIVATLTDVCLLAVENKLAYDASSGIEVLDGEKYRDILRDYKMVERGTCYLIQSSKENVKWRDLWWVLVVIAIFIFVCAFILIITICILYNKYKNYMTTERTYLVTH